LLSDQPKGRGVTEEFTVIPRWLRACGIWGVSKKLGYSGMGIDLWCSRVRVGAETPLGITGQR